jgi:PDZ domain-containing protein/aspartyl protease
MRPVFLAVFLAVGILPAPSLAADADRGALLARSRAALGGDALDRVRGLHMAGSIDFAGIKGTQEQWIDLAGRAYSEYYDAGPASGADGFDGRDAWVRDASGVVHVDGGKNGHYQGVDQAYLASYLLWSPDRGGASVSLVGERTEKGARFDVVRVSPVGGVPFDLWLDGTSALPSRVVATFGVQTLTETLTDYRAVNGLQVPFAQHVETGDGNTVDYHVTKVELEAAGFAQRVRKPETRVSDFSIGGSGVATVPIELRNNHVYIDVRLNGKGPYHFIFDTGGANIVDPAVAKEIGVTGEGNAQGSGVGAQTESLQFAKVAKLEVGAATLNDQYFAVLATRAGFGVAEGGGVDGLIGYEVIARFLTTFDYAHRSVTLRMPGATAGDAGAAVPFVFDGTTPMVAGAIDGIPADLTVDTGSRSSISVFKPFADAHPTIVPAALSAPGVNGFGVGGASIGMLGRIASLQIGPYSLSGVIADFSRQEKGAFASPYVAGNVGGGVWKRFTVTFDYPHQTMRLAPNTAFAVRDVYDRSGLFLISRSGKPTVVSARPGTPAAEAGIVKGDVIDSVDGRDASKMQLSELRDVLMGKPGTRVRLTLDSNGAKRETMLTLRDYV